MPSRLYDASVDKLSIGAWYGKSNVMARPAIVTLAAMTVLTALTAGADARQARPAPLKEATAPRDAGEAIMAIVSIKLEP